VGGGGRVNRAVEAKLKNNKEDGIRSELSVEYRRLRKDERDCKCFGILNA
jgi:hypothetical protein